MIIQPLHGLRVLDLTLLPPGGFCSVQLADFGAEVIRIEAPALQGQPSLVIGQIGLSRGKRSITLNHKHSNFTAILKRLAQSSDVLIENAKPGVMEARGFGYPQAAKEAPGLIWCSITGFGQDGPYADRSGHDLSYTAFSGLLGALSPELPWHPASMLSAPLGAMMATTGILAAVIERNRTGKGCQIDISLAEASTWLLAGTPGALKEQSTGIALSPYRRLYRCADDRFISVAATEPRTWSLLCNALAIPELVNSLGLRGEAADAVTERLADIFRTRPAAAWAAELGSAGAPVHAVNQGRDIVENPHYAACAATLVVSGENVPANPVRLVDAAGRRSGNAISEPPLVGEHTDEVLADAGFTTAEIAEFRTIGLV